MSLAMTRRPCLARLLSSAPLPAAPLRKTRLRYLPSGRRVAEIAVGAVKGTTRRVVEPPKREGLAGVEEE